MRTAELIMVTPNNNKFYSMAEQQDGILYIRLSLFVIMIL